MASALKTIPAAVAVSLGLAAPANGKERVDSYLVPDATGNLQRCRHRRPSQRPLLPLRARRCPEAVMIRRLKPSVGK